MGVAAAELLRSVAMRWWWLSLCWWIIVVGIFGRSLIFFDSFEPGVNRPRSSVVPGSQKSDLDQKNTADRTTQEPFEPLWWNLLFDTRQQRSSSSSSRQ